MSREIEMVLLLRVGKKRWAATAHGITADQIEDTEHRRKLLMALGDKSAPWVRFVAEEARHE